MDSDLPEDLARPRRAREDISILANVITGALLFATLVALLAVAWLSGVL